MVNLNFLPRQSLRRWMVAMRYACAFCIAAISFSVVFGDVLEFFSFPSPQFLGDVLSLVLWCVAFRLAGFSYVWSGIVALGALCAIWANYAQQHADPYWGYHLFEALFLVSVAFAKGPEPNGWGKEFFGE